MNQIRESTSRLHHWLVSMALGVMLSNCGSDSGALPNLGSANAAGRTTAQNTLLGGAKSMAGGTAVAQSSTGGTGMTASGQGGSAARVGGAASTGGTPVASGGSAAVTSGGTGPTRGGTSSTTTGGSAPATSGGLAATGGGTSSISSGGSAPVPSGGQQSTAGGTNGASTGGATSARGGTAPASTGGTSAATGGSGGTATDPNAATAISACIDKMPWGQSSITDRAALIDAVIKTCVEFAPPGAEWQTYCQMFLVAAMVTESSFNAALVVADAYGGTADPTVGLTQIRFSSTVKDFAAYGPVAALTRIGCNFGTIGASDTAAQHMTMMQDVACNLGLGAWYYFVFATGNGGSQVVWVSDYCGGGGIAGTLTRGMLSHQLGGTGAIGVTGNAYTDNIRTRFNLCVSVSGTHPFDLLLQPEPAKYCA
jgi:hypothetical protein